MPYISVVCPSSRVGGLDIVCEGLKNQLFKDFEFIFSDDLYKYRKDIVEEKSKEYNFRIKHVEPFENQFPTNAFSRASNTALAHADCQIVVFITDYTLLEPECLFKHASFHIQTGGSIGYLAPHQYYQLNNVHPDFAPYIHNDGNNDGWKTIYHHSNSDTLKYSEDVKSGKYNHLMWSLFTNIFDIDTYNFNLDPKLGNADPKLSYKISEYSYIGSVQYFHAKNDSIGFKNLMEVNGWSEYLDGSNGYQDTDLMDRLTRFGNVAPHWYIDITNIAKILNPRPIFPHGFRQRSVQDNNNLWLKAMHENYPYKNKYSLKEYNEYYKMKDYFDQKLKNFSFK